MSRCRVSPLLAFGTLCCLGASLCSGLHVPAAAPTVTAGDATNTSLELLHVVLRHGPRTPVSTYTNDPYKNETFYPYGWGHLTNDARRELFKIGSWLRKRYRDILGPYYQNDVLHAESTASPRTLMSLQMVLAAMFPPKKTPMEWNDRYNWQPIPIYSKPLDDDIQLRMTATCPRYDQALAEVLQRPEVLAELAQHEQLFSELSNITGDDVNSAADINSIFITLLAEQAYGLDLPPWTREYFPRKMEFMAAQNYIYNAYTTEMKRIKGGPFLQRMFADMQAKADGKLQPADRRVFMYCAHDWSITNILAALGVWRRQMPRFSALIAFELHKNIDTGVHHVEIYLRNEPSKEPQKLTVPGCEFECPLDKLLQLSKDVLPHSSYQEMCTALAV